MLDDYSEWGYANPNSLSGPRIWVPGIGEGIDPATGNPSPRGDVDVDGVVEPEELFPRGNLGSHLNPTDNYGFIGEVRLSYCSCHLTRPKVALQNMVLPS